MYHGWHGHNTFEYDNFYRQKSSGNQPTPLECRVHLVAGAFLLVKRIMAKQRYINTKLWSDGWISNLDPVEKLLFLYLLTNERTTIAGVYELPLKIMSVETGIEKEMIEKVLSRFEKDKKVVYRDGWVSVLNFVKHQDLKNEKIKKGIESAFSSVPTYLIDTLCIGYGYPSNYSNSNTNTNNICSSNELRLEKSLFKSTKK